MAKKEPVDHCDVVNGLDRQRRFAWHMYYDERLERLKVEVRALEEQKRIQMLIELLEELIYSILHEKNVQAFKKAHRINKIIQEFREKESA